MVDKLVNIGVPGSLLRTVSEHDPRMREIDWRERPTGTAIRKSNGIPVNVGDLAMYHVAARCVHAFRSFAVHARNML
ncbi:MAG: hypothetical protein AAFN94_03765 [Pseudomonadota bacterium]